MALKRILPYARHLKPVKVQFIIGIVAGVVAAAASGAGLPFIIKYMIPLLSAEDGPRGLALVLALGFIPLMFLFRAGGTFLNAYFMAYAGMYVLEQLRIQVFDRLQRLPIAFYSKHQTGDLMTRVLGDTNNLQVAITTVVNSLIKEPATLVSAIGFLVYLSYTESNVLFLLIAIASIPGCVLPIRFIGKRILKKSTQAQEQAGVLNNILNENIGATREIRAYNLQDREVSRFSAAARKLLTIAMKRVKYDKLLTPLIEQVTAFAIVFTLYVAIEQEIKPEVIASILTALYMCYQPVKLLGKVSNILKTAEASLDRLEYILDAKDSVPETNSPKQLASVAGNIQFTNVGFEYTDGEPVLKSATVDIAAGESIALIGPSGAGKTTFANLVPRFYDVTQGSVSLDGIDIRDLRKADLRQHIALVSQEAILFADTIANNIRLGKPGASDEEIQQAARMAHAHEFIQALDNGYETIVGERGSRLSGGQRQRISIARAFLKNAPIIVLDEPTSALDAESEHNIQLALEELAKGRTVLIIAHRFSTIQHADRILVFDQGEIIATGTHAELYPSNELYRSLYDKQSKTALEDQS
ncbi:ABC transporter ATP-binding protein [Coraliomargarita akajimensis]|uniref:ABC transporter related protein n=1 Tax=Coraliomargarita akajimensis (strain DSM 45221 / IAM 15411 / JCM 23193 / KCTC 12865 / 04OKA010-24) TaxID=583355 RepID=D5EP40_CORAD|nr:ABC transporter ATP-binding protein [Coraliomargarita akajimensis]ADE55550.1 ABC transporter related protein [Coraliomargarita akajimensis DSM 45221]